MKRILVSRQSVLIALGMFIVLALWLLSGQLGKVPADTTPATAPAEHRHAIPKVRVRTLQAGEIEQYVTVSGRTKPARAVTLRAEVEGRVFEVGVERGERVAEEEVIVRLDPRDRKARLAEARASLRQRALQYRAAQQLSKQGHQSETQLAEAWTQLEAARAALRRIEIELANTTVHAPFDGVLDQRPVDIGDYVSAGDAVARVLELDPMRIVGDIAQHELHFLKLGLRGNAELVTGQRVAGPVRYIASESDEATRTFRIELEVPNPDGDLAAGITSEIRIPVDRLRAHHLSPAWLSLNSADETGIKVVNAQDIVEFHPVQIVRSSADGLWAAGLPEVIRVVSVGQGFVRPGERVHAVPEDLPVASESNAGWSE